MSEVKVNLSRYDNSWYYQHNNVLCVIWYFCNLAIMKNGWIPFSSLKVKVLRLFGAKIGKNVLIKPCVNVKYPWNLEVGDNSWIGENVWIDNLAKVSIGNNVCISQGALLLCGNHNYKKSTFDLIVGEITIEDGAWVGAQSVVCPGVKMKSHSILSVGSVASSDLDEYCIYKGIPAEKVRERSIVD